MAINTRMFDEYIAGLLEDDWVSATLTTTTKGSITEDILVRRFKEGEGAGTPVFFYCPTDTVEIQFDGRIFRRDDAANWQEVSQ